MADVPVVMSAAAQVLRATGERWAELVARLDLGDGQLEAAWAEDAEIPRKTRMCRFRNGGVERGTAATGRSSSLRVCDIALPLD